MFAIFHSRETSSGVDNVKIIGAYSSQKTGEAAISRLTKQPGFRVFPDGFSIDEYEEIDKDS
jgi:hypothetical protein